MNVPEKPGLTHLDEEGRARMVDVGDKDVTTRRAVAVGRIVMREETLTLIMSGGLKKGDALLTARLAGIMAAKKTPDLIPLCHPLLLNHVDVTVTPRPGLGRVDIEASVRCDGKTGVEMEALTAVSAAALTVYDMAKAVDREMTIEGIALMSKSGGRSGNWQRT